MRQVVLDTETTGLETAAGHRIIEIGAVEIHHRRLTRHHFHVYLQPDRPVDPGAMRVHGISDEFLQGKPRFTEVLPELLEFITGAELIIHNAPFDVGFLNHELRLVQHQATVTDICSVLDTLVMARERHPGQRNSLDALCKRYSVDNSDRTLHGALLDAEILARVYLAMTGGQEDLSLDTEVEEPELKEVMVQQVTADRAALAIPRATADELAAHQRYLQLLNSSSGGRCLWSQTVGDGD